MIRDKLPVVYLVLMAMLCVLGIKASATNSPPAIAALSVAGQALDEGLHGKVATLLRTDVGLAGSQFDVRADNAVVTVSGTVPDEWALRRALNLAASVPGVREVRNDMEIDHPK